MSQDTLDLVFAFCSSLEAYCTAWEDSAVRFLYDFTKINEKREFEMQKYLTS